MIIAIEGGDQAGKATQSRMLASALRRRGKKVGSFSFPDYTTTLGAHIKRYLDGKMRLTPRAAHCLLSANRWERADDMRQAIKENDMLVMNRYYHSNIIYGRINGLPIKWLESLDSGLPKSDVVILLDVAPDESRRRKNTGRDRFERDVRLARKVRTAYLNMAKNNRWKIIDAAGTKKDVHIKILKALERRIK